MLIIIFFYLKLRLKNKVNFRYSPDIECADCLLINHILCVMVICFISFKSHVKVLSSYRILDLSKNPKVKNVEIVNTLRIKMQIPEIYHSRVRFGS
jgi:hypothetical protein